MKKQTQGYVRSIITAACAAACLAALPAHGAVLMSEDFESYAENSNLIGQGGWSGHDTLVATGSGLGSMSANGRIQPATPPADMSVAVYSFTTALSNDGVYTLSYNAYADSVTPSHNAGIYFADNSGANGGALMAGWFAVDQSFSQQGGSQGWRFDARGLTGNADNFQFLTGGYDTVSSFEVVIDAALGEVWGRADFGSGFIETTHYAVSAAQIESITGVALFQDHRNPTYYTGAEFDNIKVEKVPAPASLLLIGLGMLGLAAHQRKRKPV